MFGPVTEARIKNLVDVCARHGRDSIIVLSGVPGTGKSLLALAAAQRFARHPLFVQEIQFHQAYGYENFLEGLGPTLTGGFVVEDGVFSSWNAKAWRDVANEYVLLIEELTRANVTAVLGELMTYVEHRTRSFEAPISRRRIQVAPNLTILATMNPRDRSALEIDEALIRRLRIVDCPPDTQQLQEMLESSLTGGGTGPGEPAIIHGLVRLFEGTEHRHSADFREMMPFGHGMFAGVRDEQDLRDLWHQRIKHLLRRPLVQPHPFYETIKELYPWAGGSVVTKPARSARPGVASMPRRPSRLARRVSRGTRQSQ